MMKKKELRKLFLEKRQQLSPEEREDQTLAILHQLKAHLCCPQGAYVLSFVPMEHKAEMDTHLINSYLQTHFSAKICYPKIEGNAFFAYAVESESFSSFAIHPQFHVKEPRAGIRISAQDISIVMVPLLAFDLRGYRVGYGKGMYDVFLKTTAPQCVHVGCSFFPPVDCIEDADEEWDEPLTMVVTPEKMYRF